MFSLGRATWLISLFTGLLFIGSLSHGNLFGGNKALPADQAIQYEPLQQDGLVTLAFDLADNIYLYQDKIKIWILDEASGAKTPFKQGAFLEQSKTIEDPSFGSVAVFYEAANFQIQRQDLPAEAHTLKIRYQGCDEAIGLCYPPQSAEVAINAFDGNMTTSSSKAISLSDASSIKEFLDASGFWLIIGTFLLLGIGLTFTPCVLPMVPILSSIIAGQKSLTPSKGFALSSFYVLGMAITFALAGILVASMGARFNLQIYMQQPWVLILFSTLFVLLALAMFGLYELRLPQFIQGPLDRLNQKQSGGSFISVFLMGALSAVVVSPCVSAPLAGALIYISTTGDTLLGGLALFALGLGMGLPLIAIGTTGASVLPKAGAWMEQVKIFFGVLLVGVAIWLLGRILPESIYMAAWAVLLGVYAVVLGAFEKAETPGQRALKGISLMGFIFAILILWQTFAPQPSMVGSNSNSAQTETVNTSNLDNFFTTITDKATFEKTLLEAKDNEKLVFIDVYADWCIECKIMSKEVFAHDEVQDKLANAVNIKLDITSFNEFHKGYLEELGLFGPPALLFYGFDGNPIKEAFILGEISKADFLAHLGQFDI